ncbi:MAG: hypothetical protein IKK96_04295 [Lachnospiraceae bacterium]|nr:hypothetical protein [Lachnospiraceae bacterium]
MTALQIFLIIAGIVIIVISYFISDKVAEEKLKEKAEEIVLGSDSKEILLRQTHAAVEEILENLSDDVTVRAERELEKMSNEKIMAVHEYSETVLGEINKNHSEVMFLYSMLDDKDKEIKQTVRDVRDTIKSVKRVEQLLDNPKYAAISQSDDYTVSMHPMFLNEEKEEPAKLNLDMDITPEDVPEFVTTSDVEGKDNKSRIISLHKKGYSNLEIAKTLGLGIGEVKLVLGLYQGANK